MNLARIWIIGVVGCGVSQILSDRNIIVGALLTACTVYAWVHHDNGLSE